MNKTRYFLVGAFILVMLASTSIIALSARSDDRVAAINNSSQGLNLAGGLYSGNDAYDPAAFPGSENISTEDPYDSIATRNFDLAEFKDNGNYSGDDAYDLAVNRVRRLPVFRSSRNFSGDDIYDAAAIRSHDLSAFQDNHNYSGDDLYDAAADQ